ncbi:PIN-like domain-containing protein [Paenarthrobacter nicotinovorans]|uniref:PIN-like domain-containing protein n=1 Tax=Paenarthrobacter nicotinovorans TaxID=29320 RepID=UPI003DA605FF
MHVYTDDEVRSSFEKGIPIYFDTMVFRNLWKLHSNPRATLIESIRNLSERTYLPHQVQAELHRQAYSDAVLNNVPLPGLFQPRGMLETAMNSMLAEVKKVRPQGQVNGVTAEQIEGFHAEIQEKFGEVNEWLDGVDRQLRGWLGEQVDVTAIRRGSGTHALLDEVATAFEAGHLLAPPENETLAGWKALYVERVNQDDPVGPGKTDRNKGSLDEAAGDYYVWMEMLAHCRAHGFSDGFIFVTEERKPDIWEVQQGDKALRRVDPRIQLESLQVTGGPMYVLTFDELLELAVTDAGTREILSTISQDVKVSLSTWSESAYAELLELLKKNGYQRQRDVIIGAARAGGYIERAEIGKILGWGDAKRHLTRFRMPADRAKAELVQRNHVSQDASDPLWAVYDGPGEAIGYAVPDVFAEIQLTLDGDGGE